jgi:photosystem II stability/assembly factor-like uncharacterized protein
MSRSNLSGGGADSEQEQIRALIERVANRGAGAPDAMPPKDLRRNRRARRTKGPISRMVVIAGAALVLAAITVPLVLQSSPAPLSPKPTEAPKWGLAGTIEQPAWQVQGSPSLSDYALDCPTVSDCYATGPSSTTSTVPSGIVEVSNNAGRTWQTSLVAGAGSDLFGLNCPTALDCVVSGENFVSGNMGVALFTTRDGGLSWTSQSLPGTSLGSSIVSCGSASQCVVTLSQPGPNGQGIQGLAEVTLDGGVHWTTNPFPGSFIPYVLQCLNDHHCVAVGQSPRDFKISGGLSIHGTATAVYSDDGGVTWATGSVPTADDLSSMSCADAAHCLAVESTATEAGSNAFVTGPLIDNFVVTGDGGRTWVTTRGKDPEVWALNSVACASPDNCWAAGGTHAPGADIRSAITSGQPFVLVTDDGGQSWSRETLPVVDGKQITSVGSLTCPEATTCFALATNPSGAGSRALVLIGHAARSS